ncbi:hypothetical protein B0H15DRAFT_954752 [Mycena belliarum]|uniref:Uncharacterized protein n=1 Tax=Mycena belliarum TaxID=1033014 RepID=A0AAD6TSZ2_9AGAR|nr:hypothetical protein B0H15DRAFT_954752 [Mycena belliae]
MPPVWYPPRSDGTPPHANVVNPGTDPAAYRPTQRRAPDGVRAVVADRDVRASLLRASLGSLAFPPSPCVRVLTPSKPLPADELPANNDLSHPCTAPAASDAHDAQHGRRHIAKAAPPFVPPAHARTMRGQMLAGPRVASAPPVALSESNTTSPALASPPHALPLKPARPTARCNSLRAVQISMGSMSCKLAPTRPYIAQRPVLRGNSTAAVTCLRPHPHPTPQPALSPPIQSARVPVLRLHIAVHAGRARARISNSRTSAWWAEPIALPACTKLPPAANILSARTGVQHISETSMCAWSSSSRSPRKSSPATMVLELPLPAHVHRPRKRVTSAACRPAPHVNPPCCAWSAESSHLSPSLARPRVARLSPPAPSPPRTMHSRSLSPALLSAADTSQGARRFDAPAQRTYRPLAHAYRVAVALSAARCPHRRFHVSSLPRPCARGAA